MSETTSNINVTPLIDILLDVSVKVRLVVE